MRVSNLPNSNRREFVQAGVALLAMGSLRQVGLVAGENETARHGRESMWMSMREIQSIPDEGKAWDQLRKAAEADWGAPDLSNMNFDHNTNVLAGAIVSVRRSDRNLKRKVIASLRKIPETENVGRTLALGRNLCAYVVAAGLVGLDEPAFDVWLRKVRHEVLGGRTLISTHEKRGNNWGTHAGASRKCAMWHFFRSSGSCAVWQEFWVDRLDSRNDPAKMNRILIPANV